MQLTLPDWLDQQIFCIYILRHKAVSHNKPCQHNLGLNSFMKPIFLVRWHSFIR